MPRGYVRAPRSRHVCRVIRLRHGASRPAGPRALRRTSVSSGQWPTGRRGWGWGRTLLLAWRRRASCNGHQSRRAHGIRAPAARGTRGRRGGGPPPRHGTAQLRWEPQPSSQRADPRVAVTYARMGSLPTLLLTNSGLRRASADLGHPGPDMDISVFVYPLNLENLNIWVTNFVGKESIAVFSSVSANSFQSYIKKLVFISYKFDFRSLTAVNNCAKCDGRWRKEIFYK